MNELHESLISSTVYCLIEKYNTLISNLKPSQDYFLLELFNISCQIENNIYIYYNKCRTKFTENDCLKESTAYITYFNGITRIRHVLDETMNQKENSLNFFPTSNTNKKVTITIVLVHITI
ncbi:hypothetical protein PGO_000060 [Plasmodium gonderi]|uniref:Variable surface protein n=1 Tax=Plasmodium gonderi TaxID=77519 RepID=A0A1Y1JN63_PLAGO|nr:hypothetical protein PGO_000060 [Plasmodium gonderi]GAW83911.1 hypothetical protein PGO_000060 [Plasmodium gonderi]